MEDARPVAAVVVDHDTGPVLERCLASLQAEGARPVVVVDNAAPPSGGPAARPRRTPTGPVLELRPGRNLGYGGGANRGVAAVAGSGLVLVCNPDVELHPGALAALARVLAEQPSVAVAGPRILQPDGSRYPSARRFPSLSDALGHALLARVAPGNRFSRRYRMEDLAVDDVTPVDWVSGACLLVRRDAWEELGGFDESYFMYAEDMDLCWRARQAGWEVCFAPAATVTHLQGSSTRHHPYRMVLAHHRSALRFAARTSRGWRRLLVPPAAVLLGVRLLAEWARLALREPAGGRSGPAPGAG